MAGSIVFSDLVRETSSTTGGDNFVLDGAAAGFRRFIDSVATGAQFHYSAVGVDKPQEVEVGLGTLEADGSIARTVATGSLTNFTPGTKTIALVAGASWFAEADAGLVSIGAATDRLDLLEPSQLAQDLAIDALVAEQAAQDGAIAGKADIGHGHAVGEVDGLEDELARLVARGDKIFRPEEYGAMPGGDPAANRLAIAQALTAAATAAGGGTLLLGDLYEVDVGNSQQSLFRASSPSRLRIIGRHPGCGIRLVDDAGPYPSIFEFDGSAATVEFHGFTIDENGAANLSADPLPGSATSACSAIRINTVATDGVRISGMQFLDCPGINTLTINYSETTRDCLVDGNYFRFTAAGGQGGYDNSAIYINGRSYAVRDNRFRGPPTPEGGRCAIEAHGYDMIVANNLVEGYRTGVNLVSTNTIDPVATNSIVSANIVRGAETGVQLWAISGHALENFTISGNILDIDPGFDPSSINRSGGVVIAGGAGLDGTIGPGMIHGNFIIHRQFVGNGVNPDNDSAGICLDHSAGDLVDLIVSDNVIRDAPNNGISVFTRSGTSRRLHVSRNRIIDAGHNVANGLRFSLLWRGLAEQSMLVGNDVIDTATTGANGAYGIYTYFVAAGSSLIERDNVTSGSGGDNLYNRSSANCSERRHAEMQWPSPRLAFGGGARSFSVDLTTPVSTSFSNDDSAQPTTARESEIKVRFKNVSGGAVDIVPAAAFKLSAPFQNPVDGETATYCFVSPDGGATWLETGRSVVMHG
ncbi:hypothetical protein [Sphingomicrobium aestuariivivum]|uniref:hypothetical protein n=1 Tax=Sphingomicrobium aestuariivivum TaxID=1582356 RepID=UPI001FD6C339|nr:hypothetical protein [Sphingomicrobium aestuariivivum]MCJ8191770.1 hypothetical protein [Sphingomicrobium aestuariivivum]